MDLKSRKRIAAQLLKVGINRVKFDQERLEEIKEAITKADIRALIIDKAIQAKPKKGSSKSRIRKANVQRKKGRKAGAGSRKGKRTARLSDKAKWMSRIRTQRNFIKELKNKKIIAPQVYHSLYRKSKGGFFRSKRHIKLYIEDKNLANKKNEKKN